jgi:hypothetical protein
MRRQQLEDFWGDNDDERRVSGCGSACTSAFAEKPLAHTDAAKHRPDAVAVWHDAGGLVALPWPAIGRADYLAASPAFARDPRSAALDTSSAISALTRDLSYTTSHNALSAAGVAFSVKQLADKLQSQLGAAAQIVSNAEVMIATEQATSILSREALDCCQ